MAILKTAGGTVFTGRDVELHTVAHLAQAMALELTGPAGMSFRGSTMQAANRWSERLDTDALTAATGVKVAPLGGKRTRRGALVDLSFYLLVMHGWTMTDRVRRAIGEADAGKIERRAARVLGKLAGAEGGK